MGDEVFIPEVITASSHAHLKDERWWSSHCPLVYTRRYEMNDTTFWLGITNPEQWTTLPCHWCTSGSYAVDYTKPGLHNTGPCNDCGATGLVIVENPNVYRAEWNKGDLYLASGDRWKKGKCIAGPASMPDIEDIDPRYG